MEGVYEKLTGNSGKLSALRSFNLLFQRLFPKELRKPIFFCCCYWGRCEGSSGCTVCRRCSPGAGGRRVPGPRVLSAVLNARSALPAEEPARPRALPAGPWPRVAFRAPAQHFLHPSCRERPVQDGRKLA